MGKKVDRRIQKTRKTIKKAFVELLNKKSLEEISVYHIAEEADINRGTFYLHYQDKFDLFEKYIDELLEELISNVEMLKQKMKKNRDYKNCDIYVLFFQHFLKYPSFYRSILSFKGGPYFYTRFIEGIKDYYLQEYEQLFKYNEKQNINQETFINFVAHAHLGVINNWLQKGMKETPEDMGAQLSTLVFSLFRGYRD